VDKKLFFRLGMLAWMLFFPGCNRHSDDVHVSGTIETDEVHAASRYGGRVEKICAAEGESLTNGQIIVELEAAELRAMRAQAAAQLAELEAGPRSQEITAAKND
jgi:HlyD family secretion protein